MSFKKILNRKKLEAVKQAMDKNHPSAVSQMEDIRERLETYVDDLERKRDNSERKRNKK